MDIHTKFKFSTWYGRIMGRTKFSTWALSFHSYLKVPMRQVPKFRYLLRYWEIVFLKIYPLLNLVPLSHTAVGTCLTSSLIYEADFYTKFSTCREGYAKGDSSVPAYRNRYQPERAPPGPRREQQQQQQPAQPQEPRRVFATVASWTSPAEQPPSPMGGNATLPNATDHGDGGHGDGGHSVHLPHYVWGNMTINYTFAAYMMLLLIAITIALDLLMHFLHHATNAKKHYREMLEVIYKELTILGFLSFTLTMILEVARDSGGESDISTDQIVAFELAHLLIFIVAIVYITNAGVCFINLRAARVRWDNTWLGRSTDEVIEENQLSNVQIKYFGLLFTWEYGMPFHFDFARYVHKKMAQEIVELLEIEWEEWVVLGVMVGLFIFIRHASGAECQWQYVYNKGDVCYSGFWEMGDTRLPRIVDATASGGGGHHRMLAVSGDDSGPGECADYDSCYTGSKETLLPFETWPLILAICFGWILLFLMLFGWWVNHHRRMVVVKASAIRLKLCDADVVFATPKLGMTKASPPMLDALQKLDQKWKDKKKEIKAKLKDQENENHTEKLSALHEELMLAAKKPEADGKAMVHEVLHAHLKTHEDKKNAPERWKEWRFRARATTGEIEEAGISGREKCKCLSNEHLGRVLNLCSYINCYYLGIYVMLCFPGKAISGSSWIWHTTHSHGTSVLLHILYLVPGVISLFFVFPAIVRDNAVLAGILESDSKAVRHVEEVHNQVRGASQAFVASICAGQPQHLRSSTESSTFVSAITCSFSRHAKISSLAFEGTCCDNTMSSH
eukprot:SAG31_NODE_2173_length_6258_cov_2.493424_4_plen_790_part_00